jgi:hypothetical protein
MMKVKDIEEIRLFKEAVKRSSSEYIRLVRTTYVEDIEKLLQELDGLRKGMQDLPARQNVGPLRTEKDTERNVVS